jgi:hypothetical protein
VALCSAYSGLAHVLLVTAKVLVALCCAPGVFEFPKSLQRFWWPCVVHILRALPLNQVEKC